MEPDIRRLHSCPPPPLDDDGGDDDEDDGDVGLEEVGFGGFSVVVSCSPLSSPRSTEPITKPAPPQPSYSFNHPVEQSQPVSIVTSGAHRGQLDVIGQSCITSLHLGNGYSKQEHDCSSSLEGASSPKEETGFADFTVFTDQAAHPWCCGFSPIGSTEQWGGKAEGVNVSKKVCDPGQDSEPGSHCALKGKGDVYTTFRHCEEREPSQDHHQPQGAAAAFDFQPAESHLWEEGKPVDYWKESGHCLDEPEDYREPREEIFSNVLQAFSMYDTASEDLGSFGDDFSFEGVSAEPNVSSLTSHEDQTDWDRTDDEDEELGNYQFSDSVNNSLEDVRQSEARNALHLCKQSTTQETPAASSLCGLHFRSVANPECQQDQAHADVRVDNSGSLPASDSFADFCSAPTQEDGHGSWVEFKEQRSQQDSENCTRLVEKRADEDSEEEQAGQCGSVRRNSCQVGETSAVGAKVNLSVLIFNIYFVLTRPHCCTVFSSYFWTFSQSQWSQLPIMRSCSALMLCFTPSTFLRGRRRQKQNRAVVNGKDNTSKRSTKDFCHLKCYLTFLTIVKDAERPVVATAGHSQCDRPPVSVEGLPYEQDSAQLPWSGLKEYCELDYCVIFIIM